MQPKRVLKDLAIVVGVCVVALVALVYSLAKCCRPSVLLTVLDVLFYPIMTRVFAPDPTGSDSWALPVAIWTVGQLCVVWLLLALVGVGVRRLSTTRTRLVAAIVLTLLISAGGIVTWSAVTGIVELRVLNNSDYDFDNLTVNEVALGSVRKYQFGAYHEVRGAYHYGRVSFDAGGKHFEVTPIDYVGESPLRSGRYTYVVSIDYETGTMTTTFFVGDRIPSGKQAADRQRLIKTDHRFEVKSARQTPDQGVVIAGMKSTSTTINPTVSNVPGSRVIYLPDAWTSTGTSGPMLLKLDSTGRNEWRQVYAEQAETAAVAIAPDGGYVITGRPGAWLARVDAAGRHLWSRRFGKSFGEGRSLAVDPNGDIVVAGQEGDDTLVFKVASSGSEVWTRRIQNHDQADFIVRSSDGSYVFGGHVERWRTNDKSWVAKSNSKGDEVWSHPVDGLAVAAVESPSDEYLIVRNTNSFDSRNSRGFVLKVSGSGRVLWEHEVNLGMQLRLKGVLSADDGGFIVGGDAVTSPSNGWDFALIKVDAGGRQVWQHVYDKAQGPDQVSSVVKTSDGYLLVGTTGDHKVWLVKTDRQGVKQWDRAIVE